MALMSCPECEKEISDKAKSCPNCGLPFDETSASKEPEKAKEEPNNNKTSNNPNLILSGKKKTIRTGENFVEILFARGFLSFIKPPKPLKIPINEIKRIDIIEPSFSYGYLHIVTEDNTPTLEKKQAVKEPKAFILKSTKQVNLAKKIIQFIESHPDYSGTKQEQELKVPPKKTGLGCLLFFFVSLSLLFAGVVPMFVRLLALCVVIISILSFKDPNLKKKLRTEYLSLGQLKFLMFAFGFIFYYSFPAAELYKDNKLRRQQQPKTNKVRKKSVSCYDLGVRYGRCTALSMKGKQCSPEDDIVIPSRCRNASETQRGIKAGVRQAY